MSLGSEYAGNLTRLELSRAESAANAKRQRGQLLGNTLASLSQLPQVIQQQREQERAQRVKEQATATDQELRQTELDIRKQTLEQKDDPAVAEERRLRLNLAKHEAVARQLVNANADNWSERRQIAGSILGEDFPEKYPGDATIKAWVDEGLTVKEQLEARQKELDAAKPKEKPLVPIPGPNGPVYGTAEAGQPVYEKPAATAASGFSLSPGGARYDADGKLIASRPESAGGGQEPLVPIIGPDGKPVLVRRSQAEGKTPANSREQGRPVTSGDAGRLADLDTSLNDLATLTKTIPAGTTGVGAKAGAMLPNFVTQWTGVGADAKSKQAVIDRVKQVIGKSLEGGVLRKEDEAKYEKILPTIGDVDTVVAAKLAGLQQAISQRRQTTLDALSDAGYDISRFEARSAAPQTTAPAPKKNPFR